MMIKPRSPVNNSFCTILCLKNKLKLNKERKEKIEIKFSNKSMELYHNIVTQNGNKLNSY